MKKLFLTFSITFIGLFYSGDIMATETVGYSVHKSMDNGIEIRNYESHLVAEVTVRGKRGRAASAAFRVLAGFIFGGNQSRESVAMTAPVSQTPISENIAMTAPVSQQSQNRDSMDGPWLINFAMPAEYTLDTLPIPNDERITVREIEAHQTIAIRFSGTSRKGNLDKHHDALKKKISELELKVEENPTYAFYDRPMTRPSRRRNEIHYRIIS